MNERPEQKIGSGPDWGRRLIWLFALVFVCAASVWALVWVDCALTGGGWSRPKGLVLIYSIALGLVPLLLALGLVVVLWRFEGSPFSSPRKKE